MLRTSIICRMSSSSIKLIDIGANLTDPMYEGVYHGSTKYPCDLGAVLERAWANRVHKIICTAGSAKEARNAIKLVKQSDRLFCTVGCHPTRCNEFDEAEGGPTQYLKDLEDTITNNKEKVVAIGEMGLDYDRINFCSKEVQKKYFEMQLSLVEKFQLPMFLHCRNAASDLAEILNRFEGRLHGGVVHSFDGSIEEATRFIDMGYYIGINGCSLKTEDNLKTVCDLPSDRLMLETDCPWCEVRPSHAGAKHVKTKLDQYPQVKKEKWKEGAMVKSRNEPCNLINILEIVAAVKGEDMTTLAEKVYENTIKVFFAK